MAQTAFQAGHQEQSCFVGYNSPSPKWVPGVLHGDEQINAKRHFRMTETQEVNSVTAFTATLRADGQKQAMRRKMHYFTAPQQKGITAKHVLLCCMTGKVVGWQAGWIFEG